MHPWTDARDTLVWAELAAHHDEATVFHDPLWSYCVTEIFGHRPRHLLAWRDNTLVGILPLLEMHSLLGGRMLVSVPYGTYGGTLVREPAAAAALARAAEELADRLHVRVVDIRSADARLPGWETVEKYDAFVRALPESVDQLGPFLPKRARAAARQAREREGVTIIHDDSLLEVVWRLYARSMRRIGSLNYPLRFFQRLRARFAARLWVSVAEHHGRIVAGTISLISGQTITPYILGMDERSRCYGAANALYYSLMERAIQSGLRRWDYGRTRKDNPGSAGFKKNQGFKPRTLGYQRYVPAGQTAPDLTPSNRRFLAARQIWPRLPLAVTKPLGAWLSKSIPG